MPTPMLSEQWPRNVLPILRNEWNIRMDAYPSAAAQFYNVLTSRAASEYSQGIGELGQVPEYNSSAAEGASSAIQYDSFALLYEKTFTHKQYAKGIEISRLLMLTAQQNNIVRKAQNLGTSFGKTISVFQSSVFNNAFSSSYLGGDSKALCATDHPRNTVDSTAIDNKGTSALSYAAIIATLQAGKKMTDDRGDVMPIIYDTLYVPTELYATAIEETKGLYKPGSADFTASALNNGVAPGLRIIEDPLLTDANNWFMIDSTMAKQHLLWYWLERPTFTMDPTSDYNLVARYRGTFACSFGFDDFRFIFGHEV